MMADNYEDHYVDPTTAWRQKEPETFREVVLRIINSCSQEWSKDMRKGGTYNVETPKGILPVYFPDQREKAINSTLTLYDFLFYYFDDECKNNIKSLSEEIDGLEDYKKKTFNRLKVYCKDKRKALEDAEEITITKQVDIYRRIFRELVLLYKRKNELSMKRKIGYGD